ncbi:hypothetical protein NKH77_24720 [Streptomyces sp. M19]
MNGRERRPGAAPRPGRALFTRVLADASDGWHAPPMESGPAVFAGTAFVLFGASLLLWTVARVRLGVPVAHGVSPSPRRPSPLFGVLILGGGIWFLGAALG